MVQSMVHLKQFHFQCMKFLLIRWNSGVMIYQETNLTANAATFFYSGSYEWQSCNGAKLRLRKITNFIHSLNHYYSTHNKWKNHHILNWMHFSFCILKKSTERSTRRKLCHEIQILSRKTHGSDDLASTKWMRLWSYSADTDLEAARENWKRYLQVNYFVQEWKKDICVKE